MQKTYQTKRLTLNINYDTVTTLHDNETGVSTIIDDELIPSIEADFQLYYTTDQGMITLTERYLPFLEYIADEETDSYIEDEDLSELPLYGLT